MSNTCVCACVCVCVRVCVCVCVCGPRVLHTCKRFCWLIYPCRPNPNFQLRRAAHSEQCSGHKLTMRSRASHMSRMISSKNGQRTHFVKSFWLEHLIHPPWYQFPVLEKTNLHIFLQQSSSMNDVCMSCILFILMRLGYACFLNTIHAP